MFLYNICVALYARVVAFVALWNKKAKQFTDAGFLRILGPLHDLQLVGAVSDIAKRQDDAHHKNQITGFFAQTALSALISAQNITPPRMLRSVCRYMPRKARKGTISKSDRPVEYITPKTARPK